MKTRSLFGNKTLLSITIRGLKFLLDSRDGVCVQVYEVPTFNLLPQEFFTFSPEGQGVSFCF